jgi:hypothetical protein
MLSVVLCSFWWELTKKRRRKICCNELRELQIIDFVGTKYQKQNVPNEEVLFNSLNKKMK